MCESVRDIISFHIFPGCICNNYIWIIVTCQYWAYFFFFLIMWLDLKEFKNIIITYIGLIRVWALDYLKSTLIICLYWLVHFLDFPISIQQQKKFYRGHSIIELKLALPQRYALYSALRFWYNTLGFIMPSLLAPKAHALSQPLSITASSCTALKYLDPAKSAVTNT